MWGNQVAMMHGVVRSECKRVTQAALDLQVSPDNCVSRATLTKCIICYSSTSSSLSLHCHVSTNRQGGRAGPVMSNEMRMRYVSIGSSFHAVYSVVVVFICISILIINLTSIEITIISDVPSPFWLEPRVPSKRLSHHPPSSASQQFAEPRNGDHRVQDQVTEVIIRSVTIWCVHKQCSSTHCANNHDMRQGTLL